MAEPKTLLQCGREELVTTPCATSSCSAILDGRTVPAVTPQHAVVFLRQEEEGPFVPFYHSSSITLREVQEQFHVSSVLECDQGGNVHPRAVAFESPSDVLRSGCHYIARRDVKNEEGLNRVTFRSRIMVKEYDLEQHSPAAGATPCNAVGGHPIPLHLRHGGTPYPVRGAMLPSGDPNEVIGKEHWCTSGITLPGVKRKRDETVMAGTETPSMRFIPFTADIDGCGQDTLVTMDVLRRLCHGDLEEQRAECERKHRETERLLEGARRLLFVDDDDD